MVVAIFGATASGKSALALALARRAACEIVSVDAMQVYAGVETLTNQPSAAERAEVPHHLVGYLPLTAASSVGAHTPRAHAAIDAIARARSDAARRRRHRPLPARRADGSGAAAGRAARAERARWEAFYDERGGAAALAELARARPACRRSACTRTTAGASCARSSSPSRARAWRPSSDRLWGGGMRRPALVAVVSWPRAELRARIAARTEAMLAGGAVEEVRGAARRAGSSRRRPRRASSASRRSAPISTADATLAECAAEIALRTGQYARRQETWARRIPGAIELAGADGPERNADRLLELIR